MDVLKMAAEGLSNKAIASTLGLSLRTIKGHFESIFDKTNVSSRIEAIMMALRQEWITLEDEWFNVTARVTRVTFLVT
jgi:two-component system, NarL family, response regulator DegU